MTANHEHTPTTPEYVKDPAHFRAVYVDHMDSGKYDGPTPNASERTRGAYALQFDRMIQAVEAAAEQRGASKAFHKTQEIIAGEFERTIDEARKRDDMINTSYLIIELDAEIQDLMEGDDD